MIKKTQPYKTIEEMNSYFIRKALTKTNGSVKKSSKLLGISERTLQNKLARFDIVRNDFVK